MVKSMVFGRGGKARGSPPSPPAASIRSQLSVQASSMMAVISRKAPMAPPWSAGRLGLPISRSS